MEEMRRNTLIGLFMVVALIALGWLMTSFGEMPALLGRAKKELIIQVKDLSGIAEGDPIHLSGVQIGRVREVRFRDPEHLDAGVEIVGGIDRQYSIPNTAIAQVQPAGFGIGRGKIDLKVIEGETAPPLPAGEPIQGTMGSVWGDMIPDTLLDTVNRSVGQFGNFVESLTPVAGDLHELLDKHPIQDVDDPASESRRLAANLYTVVQRFDRTLKAFNETLGDPEVREGWLDVFRNVKQMSVDGREALDNIQKTTAALRDDLKRISDKLESGVDRANDTIDQFATDIQPVLENTDKLTATLVRLATAVEAGEGTAGMLLRDPKLYESLTLSAERLSEALDTLLRLFQRFERDNAIHLKVPTAIGRVSKDVPLPQNRP